MLLYIVPMTITMSICSLVNYKFKVNQKIFNLLNIRKPFYQALLFIFIVSVTAILVSFLCDDIFHVSENTTKIINGCGVGIMSLFYPLNKS